MNFLIKMLFSTIAVILASYLLPGVIVEDFWKALIVAITLSLLNTLLKPLLIILTIPATIFTLGLFLLVINALVVMIADYFVGGFRVDSFWWALAFSLILSVINAFFNDVSGTN